MTSFQIFSTATGADLGTYEADSKAAALEVMARDAGYRSYSAMLADIGGSAEDVEVVEA